MPGERALPWWCQLGPEAVSVKQNGAVYVPEDYIPGNKTAADREVHVSSAPRVGHIDRIVYRVRLRRSGVQVEASWPGEVVEGIVGAPFVERNGAGRQTLLWARICT